MLKGVTDKKKKKVNTRQPGNEKWLEVLWYLPGETRVKGLQTFPRVSIHVGGGNKDILTKGFTSSFPPSTAAGVSVGMPSSSPTWPCKIRRRKQTHMERLRSFMNASVLFQFAPVNSSYRHNYWDK